MRRMSNRLFSVFPVRLISTHLDCVMDRGLLLSRHLSRVRAQVLPETDMARP